MARTAAVGGTPDTAECTPVDDTPVEDTENMEMP
jgi:hypothetical protein